MVPICFGQCLLHINAFIYILTNCAESQSRSEQKLENSTAKISATNYVAIFRTLIINPEHVELIPPVFPGTI